MTIDAVIFLDAEDEKIHIDISPQNYVILFLFVIPEEAGI
jgi:hypothetical protein